MACGRHAGPYMGLNSPSSGFPKADAPSVIILIMHGMALVPPSRRQRHRAKSSERGRIKSMPPTRRRGEEVYSQIKHRLAAGFLRLGDRIDVTVLADHLGVSVTPVREALSRLFDEQLVQFAPTKGF